MFAKCFVILAASLLLATGLAMLFPWRSEGALQRGETRTIHAYNEAVIKVTAKPGRYYLWTNLAAAVSKTGIVTGTNGLKVLESKTEAVPQSVSWKTGSSRSGTTHTAPGAGITVSATVKAPLSAVGGDVMKLEWWADALERDPDYRKGFVFENMHFGYRRNHRLLLAEYIIPEGDAYWHHCWRKAFFAGLPFALTFFTVACLFLLGRPAAAADDPGAPVWPMVFPAKYKAVKLWFGLAWFVLCVPFFVFSLMGLISNEGDNMEEHPIFGLLAAAAYALPLLSAWWVRMYLVKRVEIKPEGVLIDCGDGWGRTIDLPWSAMTKVEPMQITQSGKIVARYLRIYHAEGSLIKIRDDSTSDYERLRDLIVDYFGRAHPTAA